MNKETDAKTKKEQPVAVAAVREETVSPRPSPAPSAKRERCVGVANGVAVMEDEENGAEAE